MGKLITCPKCYGKGTYTITIQVNGVPVAIEITCERCYGSGKVEEK